MRYPTPVIRFLLLASSIFWKQLTTTLNNSFRGRRETAAEATEQLDTTIEPTI